MDYNCNAMSAIGLVLVKSLFWFLHNVRWIGVHHDGNMDFSIVPIEYRSPLQKRSFRIYLSVDMEAWPLPLARLDWCIFYKMLKTAKLERVIHCSSSQPIYYAYAYEMSLIS
jgi:hypothetical protein